MSAGTNAAHRELSPSGAKVRAMALKLLEALAAMQLSSDSGVRVDAESIGNLLRNRLG